MSNPSAGLGPNGRLAVKLWRGSLMMRLLAVLLMLGQLEPGLARRQAKEEDIADDLVEGASRAGGGFLMDE